MLVAVVLAGVEPRSALALRCSSVAGYNSTQDCVLSATGTALTGGLLLPQLAQCECNWYLKINSGFASLNNACVSGANCTIGTATITTSNVTTVNATTVNATTVKTGANPAASGGGMRMSVADSIQIKNNSSVDMNLLAINGTDQVVVGGTLGMRADRTQINTGVAPDGGGIKHKRFAGCATTATLLNTCSVAANWTTPFPDANYTVALACVDKTAAAVLSANVKTGAGFTLTITTATANVAQCATVDAIAIHD